MASKTWTLEGSNLMYGDQKMVNDTAVGFPAIIDTGTSTIGVPAVMFDNLKKEWMKVTPKMDCDSSPDFCQVSESCASI